MASHRPLEAVDRRSGPVPLPAPTLPKEARQRPVGNRDARKVALQRWMRMSRHARSSRGSNGSMTFTIRDPDANIAIA